MRYLVALTLALAIAVPALAETATFGSRVLSEGDSVARVYEVAGRPDTVVELQNKYGASVGQRLEYYRDGKLIAITVSGGVVRSISVSTS